VTNAENWLVKQRSIVGLRTLVQPLWKMHWATQLIELFLSSTASWILFQMMPIFRRSLSMTPVQFCVGRPDALQTLSGAHCYQWEPEISCMI